MIILPKTPIETRVAHRYINAIFGRQATLNLWERAVNDLHEFQKWTQNVRRADLASEEGEKILRQFAFLKPGGGIQPSVPGNGFADWLVQAFPDGTNRLKQVDAFRPSGDACLNIAPKEPELFLRGLAEYERAIQNVLDQTAPTHLTYAGLTITNEEHLSETMVQALLEGIDYLNATFKKRGVEKLLAQGLKEVELRTSELDKDTVAFYDSRRQKIMLTTWLVGQSGYRFGAFDKWLHGTFLHEFGHYVHMTYLAPEARKYWDSGWSGVEKAKSEAEKYRQIFGNITDADRTRFFDLLEKYDYSPVAVAKRLDVVDKVKFGAWLREPSYGEPLITPAQFRLTKRGELFFKVLRDPLEDVQRNSGYDLDPDSEETKKLVARQVARKKELLGMGSPAQMLPPDVVDTLVKANPSLDKAVQAELDKLDVVTERSKQDRYEDFAYTFVAFMAAPEALTPTAKFRMQRTLSLSGLYGKPVMRLQANFC